MVENYREIQKGESAQVSNMKNSQNILRAFWTNFTDWFIHWNLQRLASLIAYRK